MKDYTKQNAKCLNADKVELVWNLSYKPKGIPSKSRKIRR